MVPEQPNSASSGCAANTKMSNFIKQTNFYKELSFLAPGEEESSIAPSLLLPLNTGSEIRNMLRDFRINYSLTGLPEELPMELEVRINPGELGEKQLLFSFGNNGFSSQFADDLPFSEINEKPQSYFIQRIPEFENIVFVGFSDEEGLGHALHTLQQLIDLQTNTYHHYDIIDYPDFTFRAVVSPAGKSTQNISSLMQGMDFLNSIGVNTWILESTEAELGSKKLFSEILPWSNIDFSSFNYPYIKKGISLEHMKMPAFPGTEILNDPASLKSFEDHVFNSASELRNKLLLLSEKNVDMVIFSDRTLWESMNASQPGAFLLNRENFNKFMFYKDLFSENFTRNVLDDIPDTYLIPFFSGAGRKLNIYNQVYSNALIDTSVNRWIDRILWSGPVKYAELIDATDLHNFNNVNKLSFLDYSLEYRASGSYFRNYYSMYPGKALFGIIFEPYSTRMSGISIDRFNNEAILKVSDFSEISQLRIATAIDYLWNRDSYNPDFSIWKVLVYKYGREIARELILFNDLFYKLLSVSLEMELNGYNQRLDRQGEELIIQLNRHWDVIKGSLSEKHLDFLNDLSDLKNGMISRFYQSQKNLAAPE